MALRIFELVAVAGAEVGIDPVAGVDTAQPAAVVDFAARSLAAQLAAEGSSVVD